MTTLNRILLALLLALSALGVVQHLQLSHVRADLHEANARADLLKTDLKAAKAGLRAQAQRRKAAEQAHTTRTEELQHATEANRDWAAAPVPDAVWDSLFGPEPAPAAPGVAGGLSPTPTPSGP